MIRRLVDYFLPPAICEAGDLRDFLVAQSNYLTQRASYEFSRNTLGYFGQHVFADQAFLAQTRVCRWEGFAAVLADALVLTEGLLRPAAGGRELAPGLVRLYVEGISAQPSPPHRPDGWVDLVTGLGTRLQQAAEGPPAPVREVARHAARCILDTLPIRSSNPKADRDGIHQAVHFGLVSVHDQLVRRLDRGGLAAEVAQGQPAEA